MYLDHLCLLYKYIFLGHFYITITDNPVLCDDHLYELITVLENFNARVNGASTCVAPQTTAPVLMRALNDVVPPPENAPIIVVARMGNGMHVIPEVPASETIVQPIPQLMYRRVGALLGHVLPEREGGLPVVVEPPVTLTSDNTNVVVKWPVERRVEESHPLSDHLRLRDLNTSPQ